MRNAEALVVLAEMLERAEKNESWVTVHLAGGTSLSGAVISVENRKTHDGDDYLTYYEQETVVLQPDDGTRIYIDGSSIIAVHVHD